MWREHKPEPRDQLKDFPGLVRSQKSAFDVAMRRFFYWGDSTQSAGMPRGGSDNTGVAAAFYGSQILSTSQYNGALQVASDTSRLFGLNLATVFLGSQRGIVHDSYTSGQITAGFRYLVQSGVTPASGGKAQGSYSVTFPSPFASAPRILLQPVVKATTDLYTVSCSTVSAGGFTFAADWCGTGADSSTLTVMWRASGTSALW